MGLNGHILTAIKWCIVSTIMTGRGKERTSMMRNYFLYNEFTDAEIFIVFDNDRPNISSNNHKNFTCSYVYVQYLMND